MVATGAQRHKYSIGRWESRCGCTHSPLDTRTQTQLPTCKYTLHMYTHTHINCATHSFAVLEQSDRIGGRMWASEFARFQVILVTLNPPRHIHHTHTNPRVHAHPSAPSLCIHTAHLVQIERGANWIEGIPQTENPVWQIAQEVHASANILTNTQTCTPKNLTHTRAHARTDWPSRKLHRPRRW